MPFPSPDCVFVGSPVSVSVLVLPSVLSSSRVALHVCTCVGLAVTVSDEVMVAVLVPVGRPAVLVVV